MAKAGLESATVDFESKALPLIVAIFKMNVFIIVASAHRSRSNFYESHLKNNNKNEISDIFHTFIHFIRDFLKNQ